MGIQLKQNADGSAGLEGADLDTGDIIVRAVPYSTSSALTQSSFIAPRKLVLHSITGIVDTQSSNAVTATAYKAASGTALGSGTALHSGTFNLQGTAATNQSLTLSTTQGVTTIAAGTRVGLVISGAIGAAGNGVVTFAFAPA